MILNSNYEIKNQFELLTPIIDKYIMERQQKEKEERALTEDFGGIKVLSGTPEKRFHPSSLGDSCWRRCYFKLNHYPTPPISIDLQKIFDTGHAIHSMMEGWIRGAGILLANELPLVDREHHIKGRLDNLVLIDDMVFVVEGKSIKSSKLEDVIELDEPQNDHRVQLNLYIYMLNKMMETGEVQNPEDLEIIKKIPAKISRGIILYVNKVWILERDNFPYIQTETKVNKEFIVNYDPDLIAGLLKKTDIIYNATTPDELDRGYAYGSKSCYWCDYKRECWKGEKPNGRNKRK